MFSKQQITVYPAYEGDHNSKSSEYVYVADWNQLHKLSDLRKYKVIHKGTHYYNLQTDQLVDFERYIELIEAGNIALRTLAQDLLNDNELNLRHVKEEKTRSRSVK